MGDTVSFYPDEMSKIGKLTKRLDWCLYRVERLGSDGLLLELVIMVQKDIIIAKGSAGTGTCPQSWPPVLYLHTHSGACSCTHIHAMRKKNVVGF